MADAVRIPLAEQRPRQEADPRDLLDLAFDAMFVRTFRERRIIYWNRGAELTYGFSANEALGRIPVDVLHTEYPIPLEAIEETLAATGRWEGGLVQYHRDGHQVVVNGRWALKRDRAGRPEAILEINSDITEQKRAQDQILALKARETAQLAEQAEQARELEQAKSRLLNLASHELRGPLAVLRGYISMIADGTIKPEQVATVTPILMAKATQMNSLVQQMLESARLEDSRMQLARRRVDLRSIVESSVREWQPLVPQGQRIILDADGPVMADVDASRVQTIVGNLLDNAIKYSLGHGDIVVAVDVSDMAARVRVRDAGPGIPPDQMQKLFGRFERISTEENQHIPGTGLGLHLARELARLHTGDLTATSTWGKGSEFVLTLPLASGS